MTDARPAAVSADELDAMDVPGRSTLTVGSVIDFRRPAVHRLPGTGSPSLLLPVAQVFTLCVFPGSQWARRPTTDLGAARAALWL